MTHHRIKPSTYRQRGVAAILAMMFLVIFGSLAAAMAIVSQGNLVTADSHLKINRSLAAAETGLRYMIFRLDQAARNVTTRDGLIDENNAPGLWDELRDELVQAMANDPHNIIEDPFDNGTPTLNINSIAVGPNEPTFTAILRPHPLAEADYDSAYYQREPYSAMTPPVSSTDPLDATWIRMRVQASDGLGNSQVTRSIQVDFKIDKKIRFAVLSKSRVMIGRNVMIDGPVGSRFMETWIVPNGHPIQMEDNFHGLDATLDTSLATLVDDLITYDSDGDNRINLNHPSEVPTDPTDLATMQGLDANGDGYVDSYDLFLDHYDANADNQLSATELDTSNNNITAELLELIDTFGDPNRIGYNDGVIDDHDRYAKIHGDVKIEAAVEDWEAGAADPNQDGSGSYRDFFQGSILPDHGEAPLTFQSTEVTDQDYTPADFDMTTFRTTANSGTDFASQAAAEAASNTSNDPNLPQPLGTIEREAVPYGAAHPYDYYDRPVYENMTFTDVLIPKGTNALFKNCTFIGVTFIETTTDNVDDDFNYVGMMEADGTLKHPGMTAMVGGIPVTDTKTESNNIRFHDCTFEGSVISDAPPAYTHVRNKVSFTGQTQFDNKNSPNLDDSEKQLYQRSTILTPHYSIEMGTFDDPTNAAETLQLTGTIVAGVLDMRGRIKVDGTILTTFKPESFVAPVIDENSPQFNTTLGYFGSAAGDLESEIPGAGLGMIQVRYDPTLALPDGILAPIEIRPVLSTYFEGGLH